MKKEIFILALFLLVKSSFGQEFTNLYGDYLGQTPPGDTPEVFARGIVSDTLLQHSTIAISPDGNEVFWWSFYYGKQTKYFAKRMRRIDNRWTVPGLSAFLGEPLFSVDGKKLYFSSLQGPQYVERQETGWSEPKSLGIIEHFPEIKMVEFRSVTQNGTLYFNGYAEGYKFNMAIYRSELVDGQYTKPELLPSQINIPVDGMLNQTPYIAPDESYLIYCSRSFTPIDDQGDLYICFRNSDGSWADRIKLDESINTKGMERYPSVSPDGKYFFFNRHDPVYEEDIYWVSASFINRLREKIMGE
ncbi:TolB-like translocation protein [Mangrovibacterium diazotrophicum]|uniref:WD40 repeat protein n=1 Tax=Mangrovibacterium diazotrophicum TaxID=1261403 RepID=A0A419W4V3_9BACT|nr:PD40 domain-containing protein [Mangrovibacterium diazotrophicum]RKD90475.1 WD40 repeat protein [Mangrovibacterium diazotrophicum]